jgi:hypothetical protein
MEFVQTDDGDNIIRIEKADGNMIEYIDSMFSVITLQSVSQMDIESHIDYFVGQVKQILGVLGQACDLVYNTAKDKQVIQLDATADNVVFTVVEPAEDGEIEMDLDIRLIDFDLMFKFGEAPKFIKDLLENTTAMTASIDELAKLVGLLFHRSVFNVASERYRDFLFKHGYDRVFYPQVLPPIPVSFSSDPLAEEAAYGVESFLAKISGRFNVDLPPSTDSEKMVKGFKVLMGLKEKPNQLSL